MTQGLGRSADREGRNFRRLFTLLVVALMSVGLAQPAATGQLKAPSVESVSLLKSTKPIRIGVVGDSLAVDLWYGMNGLLRGKDNIEVVKFTRSATGLIRDDVYDWQGELRAFLAQNRLDVITVILGGNDRQSVHVGGKRLDRFTKPWIAMYEQRVSVFMDALAKTKARVYWLGLPVVSSDRMTKDYRVLNGVYRRQADKHGFTYVSTWETFADASGRYSSFGPNIQGVKRQLRKTDGLHFTIDGQMRLADTVAKAINRDLAPVN